MLPRLIRIISSLCLALCLGSVLYAMGENVKQAPDRDEDSYETSAQTPAKTSVNTVKKTSMQPTADAKTSTANVRPVISEDDFSAVDDSEFTVEDELFPVNGTATTQNKGDTESASQNVDDQNAASSALPQDLLPGFSSALEVYLLSDLADDGRLTVKSLNGTLPPIPDGLQLVRLYLDRIMQSGPDSYFTCADFKHVDSLGNETTFDMDVQATRIDGAWKVTQILTHRVNGKSYMAYDEKNKPYQLSGGMSVF